MILCISEILNILPHDSMYFIGSEHFPRKILSEVLKIFQQNSMHSEILDIFSQDSPYF